MGIILHTYNGEWQVQHQFLRLKVADNFLSIYDIKTQKANLQHLLQYQPLHSGSLETFDYSIIGS